MPRSLKGIWAAPTHFVNVQSARDSPIGGMQNVYALLPKEKLNAFKKSFYHRKGESMVTLPLCVMHYKSRFNVLIMLCNAPYNILYDPMNAVIILYHNLIIQIY